MDLARLRPIALELGDEGLVLQRALDRLQELNPGDVALLPELVAWTPARSDIALATLLGAARGLGIGIITSLNLPPEITEDLPGRADDLRYNAVVVLTRHGDLHVPQAKVTPQSFEMDRSLSDGPGIGVAPYTRINRVRLDLCETIVETRILVCSDLWALTRLSFADLRCDLLIVPANFARGAEIHAARVLAAARASGLARATALVNAFQVPRDPARLPLAREVEELTEADPAQPPSAWPPGDLADAFRVYTDGLARSFVEMADLPEREERIAVPRSLADAPLVAGDYPITINI